MQCDDSPCTSKSTFFHLIVLLMPCFFKTRLPPANSYFLFENRLKPLAKKSVQIWSFFCSVFFAHSHWIRRDTEYLTVFSPNAGKYRPGKTSYLETFHLVRSFVVQVLFLHCMGQQKKSESLHVFFIKNFLKENDPQNPKPWENVKKISSLKCLSCNF